ncbi:MAG: transcription-repair coupling factor [Chloroflexi bacterium]|nr:transcription-repair coupling factor [Chloroflexota bacterium]
MDLNLAGLLPLLTENREFQQICTRLEGIAQDPEKGLGLELSGLKANTRSLVLTAIQHYLKRPLLVVTARPDQAKMLMEEVCTYSSQPDLVLNWPTPDIIPYERLGQDPTLTAGRLATLATLQAATPQDSKHLFIVASVKGLMQPTLTKTDFRQMVITLQRGQPLNLNQILGQLVRAGYSSESVVEHIGQFSRRGGILDMWPPTTVCPVRLELFGDEIESLRHFDPVTQRTLHQLNTVTLIPPIEVPIWHSAKALAQLKAIPNEMLRPEVLEEWQRILNHVEDGTNFEGIEQFTPYYTGEEKLSSLLDHLPPETLVVLDGPAQILLAAEELTHQAEEVRAEFEKQGEMPPGLIRPYFNGDELNQQLQKYPRLMLHRNGGQVLGVGEQVSEDENQAPDTLALDLFQSVGEYAGQINRLIEVVKTSRKQQQRVIIVSVQTERLREQFEDHELFPVLHRGQSILNNLPSPGSFHLVAGSLAAGWRSTALGILLLTDREIFGWTKQAQHSHEKAESQRGSLRTASQREAFLRELKPGDYVVHIEHGVARYEGLIRLKAESSNGSSGQLEREYLFLKYAEQDKLYVPIEQVDRVLPYTAPGQVTPTLNKLGSAEWVRTKRKVRQAVEDIAKELLQLYSTRAVKEGHPFAPDSTWQREMEEAFPYTETPDQMRAILEVKADMERPQPMDRLICGDVGYGKTEVALRAAFKAVLDGKQVAILVPTTILAQQHYNTFTQRLTAFPTEIEMLSRFRTKKQQEESLERLRKGRLDIIIGTHRLLQKDVVFKDLGLLVVDEEQRFGVKHKERLKQLRHEVDVLTLSATPIPRTLQMSLVGVRDMSVIETPPEQRLPVKTYVTTYNDKLVREVILRELERGGQVFFVHNRVQSIAEVALHLQNLIPEARIIVGHGQMEEGELEKVMLTFTNQEADVLVSTTIIESGLDIPNANTLIVDNAVMYGLAQLYQLRGRVGRSTSRAYAYFLYKSGKVMTEDAQKRLETMLETQELGAGFKIAMKDLEIRGAGNLLGAEQSGQIGAVGYELYIRMLEEAVEKQKGAEERPIEALIDAPTVSLSLPLPAYLPEDYVTDPAIRLDMYRKLAAPLQTAGQIRELVRELQDRFGKLPEPAQNLIYLLDIKVLAIRAGIESMIEQEGEIYIRWPAPSLETEMRRKGDKQTTEQHQPAERHPTNRHRSGGQANVDVQHLMKEFGETLRITPNQMRLNTKLLKNGWTSRLKELLEELVSG